MGIFDIFTGDPAKEAAERSRRLLRETQDGIAGRTNATRDDAARYLTGGYDDARRRFAEYDYAARGAIDDSAAEARGNLVHGAATARGLVAGARDDVAAGYRSLADLGADFRAGSKLYADALGINGPVGTARAQEAFRAGPGYQFALDQGIEAARRAGNAAHRLDSGNTLTDLVKFGSGLADQTWQSWMAGLSPYNNYALTTGQAAVDQGKTLGNLGVTEAGMVTDAAKTRAALETARGNSLADVANRYYGALGGFDVGEGTALAGNATDANRLITSADLNIVPKISQTFADEASASLMANKNLWNLGIEGAKMLASARMPTGGFPFGSLFGGPPTGPT